MMTRERLQKKDSFIPSRAPAHKQSIFAPRPFAPPVEEHEAPAAGPGIGFNFADINILPRGIVQPKLVLGPVGDKYEQEADRVARQVIEPISSSDQGAIQRQEDLEDEEELEETLEEEEELIQGKFESGLTGTLQAKEDEQPNRTGLPNRLKSGIESLSGMDLSGVRVHYNSPKPAKLNALAYTQGQEIHVASGQERHLPHEGWHAVQQMQGRVKPTIQTEDVTINDDPYLEIEAETMGKKALQMKAVVDKLNIQNQNMAVRHNASNQKKAKNCNVSLSEVIQLTHADVYVNDAKEGSGDCMLGQGQGGVSHAEQKAWAEARDTVKAKFDDQKIKNVSTTFVVDRKICSDCQDWFETTLYEYILQQSEANGNKEFDLDVDVNEYTAKILGQDETKWPSEVGDDPRLPIVDRLRQMLIEMGGLEIEEDDSGLKNKLLWEWYLVEIRNNVFFLSSDSEEKALREYQENIEDEYDRWAKWTINQQTSETEEITMDELRSSFKVL